jgi:hypothetical protein
MDGDVFDKTDERRVTNIQDINRTLDSISETNSNENRDSTPYQFEDNR